MDVLLSAVLFLPTLCLSFYAVERILNRFVQKAKREEKLRIIRNRRLELYYEMKKCA